MSKESESSFPYDLGAASTDANATDLGATETTDIAREIRKMSRQVEASAQAVARLKTQSYALQKRRNELMQRVDELTRELEKEKHSRKNEYRARISLEKRLADETARAKRFKTAYEDLKSHPILKLARAALIPMKRMISTSNQKVLPEIPSSSIPDIAHRSSDRAASVPIQLTIPQRIGSLYRREGLVWEALTLIDSLSSSYEPNPSERVLFDQVAGAGRLLSSGFSLPPRTKGIGYVPQPGRIMYCAHSTGSFNSNGYSTRTSGLTKALVEQDQDTVVVARPGYPWDVRTTEKPAKEVRFESNVGGVKTVYNPGTSWSRLALDEYIHEAADIYAREAMINRPSRIVAASNHVTALPALVAARRLGIPFAYEVRGLWEVTEASGTEGYDKSDRYTLALQLETQVAIEADHVFAITRQVRDELVRRGVDGRKISLLPNAADIYEFSPLRPETALATKHRLHDGLNIGYAGSILAYEGLDLVIHAMSDLKSKDIAARFIVVGDGPALNDLKNLTDELEVGDRVHFIGRVPSNQVPRYIEIFDVVVCPRVSSMVTEMVSPLKPLEAMSAGKTVIGSNVAPLVDLLGTDGRRGVLFNAGDSSELAETIAKLSQDRARCEQIGREARQWICANRSWQKIAKDQIEALNRLSLQDYPSKGKQLSEITVALISDEFTRNSMAADVNLLLPTPQNWKALLEQNPIDILFVESAWEGNDGSWTRKVGYYEGEEACKDLRALLAHCRSNGIPTVFWNKEDPVHFNRFRETAKFFDHVFTTDANCLKNYWDHRGPHLKTIASLPFWAQPALHNPLPTEKAREQSVAYGGSYYGTRYAKRSKELVMLLDAAIPHGLKIYDRQFEDPESPYKFPERLQDFVQGGLSYPDMVHAYKNHAAHINVNSVSNSPTMFSRRVFELAGCGTPCLSGPGIELGGIFSEAIPSIINKKMAEDQLDRWMNDEHSRLTDAWAAMRVVYRSHLSVHRLTYVLRTAGISVSSAQLPAYIVCIRDLNESTAQLILHQTHLPAAVITERKPSKKVREGFAVRGVQVLSKTPANDYLLVMDFSESLEDPLLAEDLATAIQYAGANGATVNEPDLSRTTSSLWSWSNEKTTPTMSPLGRNNGPIVNVQRLPKREQDSDLPFKSNSIVRAQSSEALNVLIAGHDLKFAGRLIEGLKSAGHNVLIDHWTGHADHDEELSRRLLLEADVIFCEWALGNLVWYSRNKLPSQRLVSRFHFQEIITKFPSEVAFDNVDKLIFVGEYLRSTAKKKFNIPETLTSVVFNTVDTRGLDRPKYPNSRFNIGLVGIVPEHKRLDISLDLLSTLRSQDERYHLFIKGRRPEEYPWMASRPQVMEYYETQYARIENDPLLKGGVTFEEHSHDMAEWYQKIGVVLSVSDFESFHYTIADGAASGAVPVGLAWAGANQIYPGSWFVNSVEEMLGRIRSSTDTEEAFRASGDTAKDFARRAFGEEQTLDILLSEILA